jgi:hypothetical protein
VSPQLRFGRGTVLIGGSPPMEDERPQVRRLVLKAKEIDPLDKVARPGDGTAISVQLIHQANKNAEARSRSPLFGGPAESSTGGWDALGDPSASTTKEGQPGEPRSGKDDESEISVEGILRENRTASDESTPELIAMPPRRKSRRNRDFVLLLACALSSWGVLAYVFRTDMQLVGLALFGIVFLTVMLAWVMFGIMDRY